MQYEHTFRMELSHEIYEVKKNNITATNKFFFQ